MCGDRDAVLPMGPTDGPPTMMTFKAFLAAQDDSITVDDAILKYNEYKLEFRRQQLNEFFVAHKDEEWYVFIEEIKYLKAVNKSNCKKEDSFMFYSNSTGI